MLRKNYLLLFPLIILAFSSCKKSNDSDTNGEWDRVSDFEGHPRSGSFVFVIDDKAYVGTGFNGTNRMNDVWMFNPDINNWYKKADFPGTARMNSVAFSINGIGYVGTGSDGTSALKDFYAYNPETDSWSQAGEIADFPGEARYGAIAFTLNGKGYVGCGADINGNNYKDFYAYNPQSNTWTQITSITGAKRLYPFAFVIDNKAYVGGGINNGLYNTDFYSYNPTTDTWTTLKELTRSDNDYSYSIGRQAASSFTIRGYGYITLGSNGSSLSDLWRYDVYGDYWEAMDVFEGSGRSEAVGFAIGNYGYIATGRTGSSRFDDCWRYDPDGVDEDE